MITLNSLKHFIGIDIGKKNCVTCVVDYDGDICERTIYANTLDAADKFFGRMVSAYPHCTAVFESTANMWMKTARMLEAHDIEFKMANPLRLKFSQSGLKTDKIDAYKLANMLRMDAIPESYVYPPEIRRILDILYDRILQVQARTRIINRQHSILDKYDYSFSDVGRVDPAGPKCQDYLYSLKLDGGDTRRMAMHVQDVRHINGQIAILEKLISKEALENEDAKLIMSMMGFEAFSALMVAACIDGIGRFPKPRHLVSFMGLCPRVYQSGETTTYGHMKKDSNRKLSWVMIHAATVAVRFDPGMKARYEMLRRRHGPKIAYSHVANYMAKCIWYMLSRREPYRHHSEDAYRRKLATVQNRSRRPVKKTMFHCGGL